jgi:hypothetical protein
VPTYPFQSSFNAGEFSPRMEGRTDIARYQNAVKTCRNFTIYPHGGVTRRAGTRFVREVKNSANKTRLIPFEFNDTQAYQIEAGDLYFRFYKDGGVILSGGSPVEVVTPYTAADVFALQFVQSADTLYIVHRSYAPRKLTRTSHTSWTLSTIDFLDGPYLAERTNITITPSATTGSVTLTASAALFVAGHVGMLFRIKHGSTWGYVKVTAVATSTSATADVKKTLGATTASDAFREGAFGTPYGYPAVITFHEGRLFVGATNNNPDTLWGSKSADYENMAPGSNDDDGLSLPLAANKVNILQWLAPSEVLLVGTLGNEFRIAAGSNDVLTPTGSNAKSATNHGSRAVRPVVADSRVLFVQRSGRKIREMSFVEAEQIYRAPNLSLLAEHLFPKNTSIAEMAYQADPDPIVWCVRSDGAMLSLTYDRTQDVVGWASHDTEGGSGIFESVSAIPHPSLDSDQVWVVVKRTIGGSTKRYVEYFDLKGNPYTAYEQLNTDCALTYDGTRSTALTLSAVSGSSITATAASSVFVAGDVGKEIRVPGGGRAEITGYTSGTVVTASVKNTFASVSIASGGWGVAVFGVSGLGHLEGKSVAIVGDGSVYNNATVASGAVTLSPAISALRIEVGLPYTSVLETLRPEVQLRDGGTSQGRKKRWNEVIVRVYSTLGLKLMGETMPFREAGDKMDAPPPLVSKDVRKTNLGWDREGRILVEQPYALPATVNALTGTLEVTEG